jgi:hypothetical protein
MTIENLWQYRADAGVDESITLVGYDVIAPDGRVGQVDEDNHAVGDNFLVVGTGPWIFGGKVLLPAGTVTKVDREERKVFVARTKEEIKAAPEFDASRPPGKAYRDEVAGYYARIPGTR